jgi:hypothetical protein
MFRRRGWIENTTKTVGIFNRSGRKKAAPAAFPKAGHFLDK